MDMHHVGQFAERGVLAHEGAHLLHHVGTMGTKGMGTEDEPIGRGEEFEHSLCLTHGKSLAIGAPERLLADIGCGTGLELVLGGTYAGSLGGGEDGSGHDVEADAVSLTYDMVDSAHSLHLSSMGQHLTTIAVANGIDALDGGLEMVIDGDGSVGGQGDAYGFKGETLGTGLATSGHEDDVGIDVGKRLHCGIHLEGDATTEVLAEALGDVAVEGGKALLEILDDGNLGTEAMEGTGKLHTDDARTDDAEALGQCSETEQTSGIDHTGVAIDTLDGEPLGLGACGDDDVGSRIVAHRMGIDELRLRALQRDARMREDGGDTLTELGNDLLRMTTGIGEGGLVDIALRGDATHIEARASQLATLEDDNLQALFGSIFCSAIAPRARTNHNQINFNHFQSSILSKW